jgi:hypothetical protein
MAGDDNIGFPVYYLTVFCATAAYMYYENINKSISKKTPVPEILAASLGMPIIFPFVCPVAALHYATVKFNDKS